MFTTVTFWDYSACQSDLVVVPRTGQDRVLVSSRSKMVHLVVPRVPLQ